MALGDVFKLSKLTIAAHADEKHDRLLTQLEVQFNPESLSLRHEATFQTGYRSGRQKFQHPKARTLQVGLVFDGTGVGYMGVQLLVGVPTVGQRIQAFMDACAHPVPPAGEAAYLKLTWGQGVLGRGFSCRLVSADVKYTAFERDGSPLRAELTAVFAEHLPTDVAQQGFVQASTQSRTVSASDSLPLLCLQVYGSAAPYLQVAAANGLDDFRDLSPGQALVFPPLGSGSRGQGST